MEVHNNNNNVPMTIEDEIEVIDLDDYLKVSKGVVERWDKKIKKWILEELIGGNEQQLEKFLEQYKKSLKEEATLFRDRHLVENKFCSHMKSIYFCCSNILLEKSHWTPYMEEYENLLAEYCTLELSIVQHLTQKRDKNTECAKFFLNQCTLVYKRLCNVLSGCLRDSEKHTFHVLLKLRYNAKALACKSIMNGVFSHYMIDRPQQDYSDEAFCRYFLALKRWKQIREPRAHASMEMVMYKRMNRSNDCIKNSETIQTILGIRCLDSVAIFSLITDTINASKDAYFNYIRQNKGGARADESDCSLKISSDDDSSVMVLSDDDHGDDDDVEIVQVSGPVPINVMDDDGPLETPKRQTETRHIEEVAKEQIALVVEENEEELLHYQLEESVSVPTKEVSMEEVIDNVEEQIENVLSTSDIEDEDEILNRFNDITTHTENETNSIDADEEMHLIEEETTPVEQNRKIAPVEVETENVSVEENNKISHKEGAMQFMVHIGISEEKRQQYVGILSEKGENAIKRHSNTVAVTPPEEEKMHVPEEENKEIPTEEMEVHFNQLAVTEENRELPPEEEEMHFQEEENREIPTEEVHFSQVAVTEENRELPPEGEEMHFHEEENREIPTEEVHFSQVAVTEENRELPPEGEEMHFHEEENREIPTEDVEVHFNQVAVIEENGELPPEEQQIHFHEEVNTSVEEYSEILTGPVEGYFNEVTIIEENLNHEIATEQVTDDIENNFQGKECYIDSSATRQIINLGTENIYAYSTLKISGPQELFKRHYCDDTQESCSCQKAYVLNEEDLVFPVYEAQSAKLELTENDVPEKLEVPVSSIQDQPLLMLNVYPKYELPVSNIQVDQQLQQQLMMENIVIGRLEPSVLGIQEPQQNNVPENSEPPVLSTPEPPQLVLLQEQRTPKHVVPEELEPSVLDILPPQLTRMENNVPEKSEPPVLSTPVLLQQQEAPPVSYKPRQLQRTRRNGTKSKSDINKPMRRTRNGLTGHNSYTIKEPPITQKPRQRQQLEKDLVNGGVEYPGNNGGILTRGFNNNKRLRQLEQKTSQRKTGFDDNPTYNVYDSECDELRIQLKPTAARLLKPCIKRVAPCPIPDEVSCTLCNYNCRDARVDVNVMPKVKMEELIDKRKRKRIENAVNRLKSDIPRPLELRKKLPLIRDQPQQQQQQSQLIRVDYNKSTPPAPSPPAVSPSPPAPPPPSQQEHQRLTSTTPCIWPERTVRGKQKGNRSVGVNKTSIASRTRTKVNGESVSKPSMDVLFDNLRNGTDSPINFKKGDKT